MKVNKEKFSALISNEKTDTVKRNRKRITNRQRLRESREIALKVLNKLDQLEWSQKLLAQKMNVTPQEITKIVSGKHLLSLEIKSKLKETLEISNLETFKNNSSRNYHKHI